MNIVLAAMAGLMLDAARQRGVCHGRRKPRPQLAAMTCAALDQAVTSLPAGPVLVASYPPLDGHPAPILALRGVAFTYDNALASIALFACGKAGVGAADRRCIGLRDTARSGVSGRTPAQCLRRRSGGAPSMKLPGYWSVERNAWNQDAYQVSSATGNQAWAALALLEAYRQSGEASYLEAARKVLHWSQKNTYDGQSPAGFSGGYYGYFAKQVQQNWKSTEHNVDLAAAWSALDAVAPNQRFGSAGADCPAVCLEPVGRRGRALPDRHRCGWPDLGPRALRARRADLALDRPA